MAKGNIILRNSFLALTMTYYFWCFVYTWNLCWTSDLAFFDNKHVTVLQMFIIGFILFRFNTCLVKHKNIAEYDAFYQYSALVSFFIIFLVHTTSFVMIEFNLKSESITWKGREIQKENPVIIIAGMLAAVLMLFSLCDVLKTIENVKNMNANENTSPSNGEAGFESSSVQQLWDATNTTVDNPNKGYNILDNPHT